MKSRLLLKLVMAILVGMHQIILYSSFENILRKQDHAFDPNINLDIQNHVVKLALQELSHEKTGRELSINMMNQFLLSLHNYQYLEKCCVLHGSPSYGLKLFLNHMKNQPDTECLSDKEMHYPSLGYIEDSMDIACVKLLVESRSCFIEEIILPRIVHLITEYRRIKNMYQPHSAQYSYDEIVAATSLLKLQYHS